MDGFDESSISSRNISGLCSLSDIDTAIATARSLCNFHVLIVGIGGAGSNVILQLLSLGVVRFTLIDPDVIELSNLNRQILFSCDDVGESKVDIAARYIEKHSHYACHVTKIQADFLKWAEGVECFKNFDFAVISADSSPHTIRRLASKMFYGKIPFMFLGYQGWKASIGPFWFPPSQSCGCCILHLVDDIDAIELDKSLRVFRIPPSTLYINSILASVAITVLLHWKLGNTLNFNKVSVDLRCVSLDHKFIKPIQGCPVCSNKNE